MGCSPHSISTITNVLHITIKHRKLLISIESSPHTFQNERKLSLCWSRSRIIHPYSYAYKRVHIDLLENTRIFRMAKSKIGHPLKLRTGYPPCKQMQLYNTSILIEGSMLLQWAIFTFCHRSQWQPFSFTVKGLQLATPR